MKLIIAIMLATFSTVVFSLVFVLAAQNVTLSGSISIRYVNTQTLASNFKTFIPSDCTSVVFDYAENHLDIVEDSSLSETTVDSAWVGLEESGISLFYKPSNKTAYILSYGEIFTGTSCFAMFYDCNSLTSIQFNNFNTENAIDMRWMFYNCSALMELDVSNFNTNQIGNMSYMFSNCSALTNIEFGDNFNTENVTDMSYMFSDCSTLTELVFDDAFNTNKVTRMDYMFSGCLGLTNLDVSTFNTSKVTNMYGMFYACSALTELNLDNFTTDNVKQMEYMFYHCSSLTELDLSSFNTFNVVSMRSMFYECSSLTGITFGYNFNTTNVTSMYYMFSGCSGLTNLDVSNFNTSKVTDMYGMFYGCYTLTELDVSSFNTTNVTSMGSMFRSCSGLTKITFGDDFKTDKVTSLNHMFYACYELQELDLSNFNTSNVARLDNMFYACNVLTELDLTSFNTSNVTLMTNMFYECFALTTIYVGADWNTDSVTDGYDMFYDCTSLVGQAGTVYNNLYTDETYAHIDGGNENPGYLTAGYALVSGSNFNSYIDSNSTKIIFGDYSAYSSSVSGLTPTYVSQHVLTNEVTDDIQLYYSDSTKTTFILSKSVIMANDNCQGMFYNKTALKSIQFENFNTTNVTKMGIVTVGLMGSRDYGMFEGCSNLTNLDLSTFDTSKVTNMAGMFYGCSSLVSLDLSSFDTSNVTHMSMVTYSWSGILDDVYGMFGFCSSLKTIYVGQLWSTSSVTESFEMFDACSSLVGGAGTTYNSSHEDITYACVDGGTASPGYLTLKS